MLSTKLTPSPTLVEGQVWKWTWKICPLCHALSCECVTLDAECNRLFGCRTIRVHPVPRVPARAALLLVRIVLRLRLRGLQRVSEAALKISLQNVMATIQAAENCSGLQTPISSHTALRRRANDALLSGCSLAVSATRRRRAAVASAASIRRATSPRRRASTSGSSPTSTWRAPGSAPPSDSLMVRIGGLALAENPNIVWIRWNTNFCLTLTHSFPPSTPSHRWRKLRLPRGPAKRQQDGRPLHLPVCRHVPVRARLRAGRRRLHHVSEGRHVDRAQTLLPETWVFTFGGLFASLFASVCAWTNWYACVEIAAHCKRNTWRAIHCLEYICW